MQGDLNFTITILELDEIRAVLEEALAAVPDWEQAQLRERLRAVYDRGHMRSDIAANNAGHGDRGDWGDSDQRVLSWPPQPHGPAVKK